MMANIFNVHEAGDRIRVVQSGSSIWIDVPLSDDHTATLAVFLTPADCDQLAGELTRTADRMRRIDDIQREARIEVPMQKERE